MKGWHFSRLAISVLAGFFMTMHGHWHRINIAFITPMFYVAFLFSSAITYVLIVWVRFVHHKLKSLHHKKKPTPRWAIFVIVLGIVVPALTDILIFTAYFELQGKNIVSSLYLRIDFPLVLAFILVLNIYYWSHYRLPAFNNGSHQAKAELLNINYNGVRAILNPKVDIIYVYRSGKLVKVLTVSGDEYAFKDTIGNLNRKLQTLNFCQINPSVIVNLNTLKGYAAGTTRDTLVLLFKIEYQELLRKKHVPILRVTKEHIANFKHNMQRDGIE